MQQQIRTIITILYISLTLMILGYFTLSESVAITQGLKILFRVGSTGAVIWSFSRLKMITVPSFQYNHLLAFGGYLLYLLLGLVSFCWSTKVSYSALQWFMAAESMLYVLYFVKSVATIQYFFPEQRLHFHTMFGVAIAIILSGFLIGAIVDPDDFFRETRGGEESRFGGYFMNPNELGMLSSIGASLGVMEFSSRTKKLLPGFIFIVCLISLALTSSRSSTIGFLIIAWILLNKYATPRMKLLAVVAGAAAMPFIINAIILKAGDMDEVLSMTGRLPFWTALLNEGIVREPFFGYGFMRINYTDAFQSVHTYAGKMTHNTFMQVLMNLGFVGLFIVIIQVTATIRGFRRMTDISKRNVFLAIFIPALINSFTEFGIFGEANYGILFYQFLIVLIMVEFHPVFSHREKVKLQTQMVKANLSRKGSK